MAQNYIVKMRNSRTGKVEAYRTATDDVCLLNASLELFALGGYTVLSCEKTEG